MASHKLPAKAANMFN